jgi:ADP-ribose pyrophosphatase
MEDKLLYVGPIFKLVKTPGPRIDYDVIRHPGGVGILAVLDGKILLVKQLRPALGRDTLEIPAGKLEYGEDPKEAAIRELNEETGYACEDMKCIQTFASTPGFCDEILHIYQAVGLHEAQNRLAMDEDEDIELVWLPLEQALAMALSSQLEDAKTLIAIYRACLDERKKGSD